MNSIPASAIVNIIPGVIGAGGNALAMSGLALSTTARVPIGSVLSFANSAAVSSYFGTGTAEAAAAAIYFAGFDNGTAQPGAMLFAQYPAAAVGAFLRGGNVSSLTMTQLQALSGTLALTVNGTLKTSAAISLAGATSFSNAATLILAGFTSPGFTVTYDSVSGGFLFTDSTTGSTSTLTFCTAGTLANGLALTQATGAVLSQGAAAATPAAFMAGIIAITTNWASFFTLFDPDGGSGNTLKQAFAAWNGAQNNEFVYVCWDTDVTPTLSTSATTSLGYLLAQAQTSGTCLLYAPDYTKAAFVAGFIASLDFTRTNGRATLAYKHQAGLTADVTNITVWSNLLANGYNAYSSFATANQQFTGWSNGQISGQYKWLDGYVNQVWMNSALQLAIMNLLFNINSLPYNDAGYALVAAACADPINAAVKFGAIRPGVPLSALQIAEVNTAAGVAIDGVLSTRGWYLQIQPATAIVRGARTSPPCTLFYMDGGSIQSLNLASIEVQ